MQHSEAAADVLRRNSRPPGSEMNEETLCGSAAATVMTSVSNFFLILTLCVQSMIKQSLAVLRGKLDRMRRDKEAVQTGI